MNSSSYENYKNGMCFKKAFNRQRRQFGCCFVFQSVKEQASYLFLCLSISILTQTSPQILTRNVSELYSYGLKQRKRLASLQQLTTAFSCYWALTYLQKDTPHQRIKRGFVTVRSPDRKQTCHKSSWFKKSRGLII